VNIDGTSTYGSGQAWGFDGTSATLSNKGTVTVSGNSFTMNLPALSAMHVVLSTGEPPPITGVGGASSTGGAGPVDTVGGGGTVDTAGGSTSVAGTDTGTASDKKDSAGCSFSVPYRSGNAGALVAIVAALLVRVRRRR
jgi:hypothetical protein